MNISEFHVFPIRLRLVQKWTEMRPSPCKPWKVLEFQKTEKVLELFWKKSGRPWKVWNLSVSLCEHPTVVAVKLVEELLRPFYECLKSVCAIEWWTGRRDLNYWVKRHWKVLNILWLVVQEPCLMPTELLDAVVTYHFLHLYQQKNCSLWLRTVFQLAQHHWCIAAFVFKKSLC